MASAASVEASTVRRRRTRPGASPRAALQRIRVRPIPKRVAKELLEREHYLKSLPGGTKLAFGAFVGKRLLGALTLGVGSIQGHSLVEEASQGDCITFTRFWLSEALPSNSESRVIGVVMRALRRHTSLKFVLSYADPEMGHVGVIYQATGWLYTGLSQATPLYDVGDGRPRHGRTLGHSFGTHSVEYLKRQGVPVRLVKRAPKHRYLYAIDPDVKTRISVPVMPYPKKET